MIAMACVLPSLYGQQQLTFAYDSAGNRVSRTIRLDSSPSQAPGRKTAPLFFQDMVGATALKIYPNPVRDILTIQLDSYAENMEAEYALFSLSGVLIEKGTITGATTAVNMSAMPSGTYLLNIQLCGEATGWKVIKQ